MGRVSQDDDRSPDPERRDAPDERGSGYDDRAREDTAPYLSWSQEEEQRAAEPPTDAAEASRPPQGYPDDWRDTTQPLQPEPQPQPWSGAYGAADYAAPSGYAGYSDYSAYSGGPQQPTYPYASVPQAAGRRQPGVPGWLWPVVAALALVVGLLGGTLGGVAVSRSLSGETVSLPVLETDRGTAPPLEADNTSIAAVAGELLPSTVQILAEGGAEGGQGSGGATGSGFVLDREGHVITNNHVVAGSTGPEELTVVDDRGREYPATIVGRSPVYDIAVLDLEDAEGLQPAALGSSQAMRVGESVVAIGSPLGLSSTVTSGIVSALNRPVTTGGADESSYINAVQTDAAINPGNSGGPLVNLQGQVVGVNSAIATTGGFGESGNIGVGFAIPMEQVRVTTAQILATGEAQYPVIGANVNTGSRQVDGAEVVEVPSGTPADEAGLQEGDVVTALDGVRVTDGIELIVAIRARQPGETVRLSVLRDGEQETVRVRLDAKVG
jgi:putative serine protease PepD